MKRLKLSYKVLKYIIISFFLNISISNLIFATETIFEIKSNNFTDTDVIISLLKDIPKNIDKEYSNEIIKILNDSNLFSDVNVKLKNNKYLIDIKEFPNIDNLYFDNNNRLEDDDLRLIANQTNLKNLNTQSIDTFMEETKKIYKSFGFNNIKIDYSKKIYQETNTVDLYFDIDEGKITKIIKIIIDEFIVISQDIREIIQSKPDL